MTQQTLQVSTIFCHDNLPVLRGINSESVDLIYLDPPFNKGKNFHTPSGTTAEGADFSDIWTPDIVKDEWHNEINDRYPRLYKYLDAIGDIGSRSAKYYLLYMAVRLIEMHRILKPTGSLYLHCDPTASHYLKLLLDTIFGHNQFRNEIIWYYKNASRGKNRFAKAHDTLFFYSKGNDFIFNREDILVPFDSGMTEWRYTKGGQLGKDMPKGKIPDDVIVLPSLNAMAKERVGYPTQKPLVLLEHIIKASSNEGDIVLDPFCGGATTCIAAARLNRQWVGIDVSRKAYDLVKMRLQKEVPSDLVTGSPIFRDDCPTRTDKEGVSLFVPPLTFDHAGNRE